MNKVTPEERGEMNEPTQRWHSLLAQEVFSALEASAGGLSTSEAARRLAQVGPNELAARKKKPAWMLFLEQFKSFLLIILILAAVVSGVLAVMGEGYLPSTSYPVYVVADTTWTDGLAIPSRVADTATYEAPERYPAGMPYVFVNGELAVDEGLPTGHLPGKVLRKQA